MNSDNLINDGFIQACKDYYYLIDRNYPERGTLKLIGDRYKLTGDQRTVLYRGISSVKNSDYRKKLLVDQISGKQLIIDGYNVLFSLLNYRLGRWMFIATDQVLRDAGSLHGKIRNEDLFRECLELMMEYFQVQKPERVEVFLDSPVSHSLKHAHMINDLLVQHQIKGNCHVVRSADWALKQFQDVIIATSDTVIIEKSGSFVFDLPRNILETLFKARFIDLNDIVGADV